MAHLPDWRNLSLVCCRYVRPDWIGYACDRSELSVNGFYCERYLGVLIYLGFWDCQHISGPNYGTDCCRLFRCLPQIAQQQADSGWAVCLLSVDECHGPEGGYVHREHTR